MPLVDQDSAARRAALACLLTQLKQWPDVFTPVLTSLHEDSRRDVVNALRILAEEGAPRTIGLYLEDDVVLAPDFGPIAKTAANMVRFGLPYIRACSLFRLRDDLPHGEYHTTKGSRLNSSCALMLEIPDPVRFATFSKRWYEAHPEHRHASDLLIGDWIRSQGSRWLTWAPSAVQHRNLPSTLGPRSTKRISLSYERHYGPIEA